ncbi:MAG: DoxX family protein [Candidatus Rokubacteria bacterium]|nr:DoxX family protein [Candidatus Rokubacteria bacterium]
MRVVLATILSTAGWQKLGGGLDAIASGFGKMGIPLPAVSGPFVVGLEVIGGALLLVGLFSRWVALLFAFQFVVATFYVKWAAQGFGAARLDLMILAGSLLVVLAGPGRAALDRLWLERDAHAAPPLEEPQARRRSA